MNISRMGSQEVESIAQLALILWSDAVLEELTADFFQLASSEKDLILVGRDQKNIPLAFAHIALRYEYVEGASASPCAYLEGIFVQEDWRKKGIGRILVEKGRAWAKEMGCKEFASDVELHNTLSQDFHRAMGFKAVNRIICYVQSLEG